jgi:hypothetical protein
MAVLDGRIEEQTRMRLDDHRLHMGTVTHIRTGVEDLSRSQIQLAEHVDVQDKSAYLETEKKLQKIKDTVSETVPLLIEAKLTSIKGAMESIHATETEMKEYLIELEKARPEEGRLVFTAFKELKQEVTSVKAFQMQQAAATTSLSTATAAGLNGLAATGVSSGLSATHVVMLDKMKEQIEALVIAEHARPCHCEDVDNNTGRIAYLEAQVASMQGAATYGTAAATSFSLGASGTQASAGNGAAGSADGLPLFVKNAAGGNGVCHCVHVEQLLIRVRALEQARIPTTAGQRAAFLPSMRATLEPPPGMRQGPETIDIDGKMNLTLPLGHLGNDRRDKSIYDDKMMTQPEYRFDGVKEGAKWKSKIERYFITKVPVAM